MYKLIEIGKPLLTSYIILNPVSKLGKHQQQPHAIRDHNDHTRLINELLMLRNVQQPTLNNLKYKTRD